MVGRTGGNVLGAELGGELKRDKVVERDVTNAGTVRGAIETLGRNWGKPNTASWTLLENSTDKTGAPVSLARFHFGQTRPSRKFPGPLYPGCHPR